MPVKGFVELAVRDIIDGSFPVCAAVVITFADAVACLIVKGGRMICGFPAGIAHLIGYPADVNIMYEEY
ncbi:MAG: hypothetical protein ICV79_20885 [Flavisolibacter sp.]|nr:hypothetical protein [Flavisolibacter sp.]